jgi:hypothetical protein
MATYHIAEGQATPARRIRDSFIFTGVWLLGFSALTRLADGRWYPPVALAVGGAVFFLGGVLTSFWWPRGKQSFDLEVDDREIRVVWESQIIRKVRRDRVRYVRERWGIWGTWLVVSEESSFGKRFFGRNRVALPKWLFKQEEYEQIKAQALSWLENSDR